MFWLDMYTDWFVHVQLVTDWYVHVQPVPAHLVKNDDGLVFFIPFNIIILW